VGNSPAEDYYFINMGDARATSKTGLRIGGDAKNDIWGQGAAGAVGMAGPGCCTTGFKSLNDPAGFVDGQSFSYGYNWDWIAHNAPGYANGGNTLDNHDLLTGKYLAGRYTVTSADSLQDLVNKVNAGTQSRVGIHIDSGRDAQKVLNSGGAMAICVGEEAYIWGDLTAATGGSAKVAQYLYTYSAVGYYSNADHTVFTTSATVASALGFDMSGLAFTVMMQRTTDANGAAAEINRQIAIAMADGKFVGNILNSASGGYAVASAGTLALYKKALEYLTLDSKIASPQYYTVADVSQTGWTIGVSGSAFTGTAHGPITLNDIYSWAIDPGQTIPPSYAPVTGDRVVSNIWVNDSNHFWTTSGVIGQALAVWNSASVAGIGWHRLSVEVETGDTYDRILQKFQSAISTAQSAVKSISILTGSPLINTSAFGVWWSASTGMWTNVAGVASALNLTKGLGVTYTVGMTLAEALADVNSALGHASGIPSVYVKSTHAFTGTTGTAGINFWVGGAGNWTDDGRLGAAMGYNQVMLNLTYNQRIDSIMSQLNHALGTSAATRSINKFGSTTFSLEGKTIASTNSTIMTNRYERKDDAVVKLNGYIDSSKQMNLVGDGKGGSFNAYSLASAINHNKESQFWAMLDRDDSNTLYVFNKEGGEYNNLLACDVYDIDNISQAAIQKYVNFENVETGFWHRGGTNLSLGTNAADVWAKMKPVQTKEFQGNAVWNVTLNGKDVGKARDLWITAARELLLPGIGTGTNRGFEDIINGLDRYSFVEIQNAADGIWAGADVRTQSHAQEALDALNYSINVKDKVRADLGAVQNRLENTMTNLEIQAENLQASESRISDVDVAKEMTEFTKNNVLTQAAVGMLSQANSLGQLALSLIGG